MPPRRRRDYTKCTAIEKMRLSAGWTQEELARMAKISVRTLQRIESGETKNPAIRPILNIAAILGCELEDVIEPSWGDFRD